MTNCKISFFTKVKESFAFQSCDSRECIDIRHSVDIYQENSLS